MRIIASILALSLVTLGLGGTSDARADAEQFTAAGCVKCHTISALKIAKVSKGDDDEEDSGETPDLSTAGKFHDAAFFKTFLMKEAAHVAHEGNTAVKKHPVKFKGSPEDLDKMSAWIATLK